MSYSARIMYSITIQEIYDELVDRYLTVKQLSMTKPQGKFDEGYDCRLVNEELWLEKLLSKIEQQLKQ